jgi:nucleolysin TIA-1/TIAR
MWDATTMKSRGFGFVSFKDKDDAESALATMNGVYVGSRPIRVNWASHRIQPKSFGFERDQTTFEHILVSASPFNTTVYVGNLAHDATRILTVD